jgi:hypothetical protein
MRKSSVSFERAICFSILVVLADPCYAYLDPGTGSAVTATILGFFGAVAYTARKYVYKVRDLFAGNKRRDAMDGEE